MNSERDAGDWIECPAGTLQGLAGRLHRRRRNRQALKGAATVCMLFIAVAAGWVATRPTAPGEFPFGGIACADVHHSLSAYAKGELAPDVTEKVEMHLAECPRCQEALRRLQEESTPQAASNWRRARPTWSVGTVDAESRYELLAASTTAH